MPKVVQKQQKTPCISRYSMPKVVLSHSVYCHEFYWEFVALQVQQVPSRQDLSIQQGAPAMT